MAGQYLSGADAMDPLASPLSGDLAGLPPQLIVVGGAEALLDDSLRFARKAALAGVDVTVRIGAAMQHSIPSTQASFPSRTSRSPRSANGSGDACGRPHRSDVTARLRSDSPENAPRQPGVHLAGAARSGPGFAGKPSACSGAPLTMTHERKRRSARA